MKKSVKLDQNDSNIQANQPEKGIDRRELLVSGGRAAATAALITSPLIAFLKPERALANSTLNESPSPQTPEGYRNFIDRFRMQFGRRMDYQQGFAGAARTSNRIFELPADVYGVLADNSALSFAIGPASRYPVEEAGYLHATQTVKDSIYDQRRWSKASIELQKSVRRIILEAYPEYRDVMGIIRGKWLLDEITAPVVTLRNYEQKQLEMFLRVPKPGTREFFLMSMEDWGDNYDQAKLRHEHAWDNMYDPSRSLFDNLETIYGPQLQAFRGASQAVKNRVAQFINFMNQQVGRRISRSFTLSRAQKDSLNMLLGVTGTRFEIR